MTDSQQKVLYWLTMHNGWFRPSEIEPADYPGGASSIGKVLGALVETGKVEVHSADRGNGTTCLKYRAKSTLKLARPRKEKRNAGIA